MGNDPAMSMLENFSGAEMSMSLAGQVMAIALAAGDTFNIIGDANILH